MDAYNANPSSTRLALENFNEINHDHKDCNFRRYV